MRSGSRAASLKFLLFFLGLSCVSATAAPLKLNGSTTVNLPVAEAAEMLRRERKMDIQIDTHGGSSGGISAVGDGLVQIGMVSKPLSDTDRAKYPGSNFKSTRIGEDAVAIIVSKDVWDSGVRTLTRQQARDIYEGRIRNWKELGGADRRIAFFNKEPGRGTWEVFVNWVYGDAKKAPPVNFPEVGGNEETRSKVSSTRGAISQLSASWVDGEKVFALGIKHENATVVSPTPRSVGEGLYPMSRPLLLLTDGEPRGDAKVLVDFLLGDRGQVLVRKHGYLSLDQLQR